MKRRNYTPHPYQPVPLAARFWPKVDRRGPGECWPWTGAKRKGYGAIWHRESQKVIEAPRAAWLIAHGDLPADLEVCHRCDNPACVNVAHLFLGTHADNMADMLAKGRARPPQAGHCPGERNGSARLSEPQVREILLRTKDSQRALAREFGVSRSTIQSIKTGRSWRHLEANT